MVDEELRQLVKMLKESKVKKFKSKDYEIEFDVEYDPPTFTDEQRQMLEKANEVTDEEIMMNPYAGLE